VATLKRPVHPLDRDVARLGGQCATLCGVPDDRLELAAALDLVEGLRRACRTGHLLNLAVSVPDAQLDVAQGGTWPAPRRLPAELVRQVLLDPDLHSDPRGLMLCGVALTGVLDLHAANLPCPLTLRLCYLEQPPNLANATVLALSLQGCHLPGLLLDGVRIDGGAFCEQLTVNGQVRASGARITGQLDLRGATLTNPNGNALTLDGARVDGGAFLDQLTAIGQVRAVSAHITGQLGLQGATLTNPNGDALILDGARIGSAFLHQLTAAGVVRASGAHITGQLDLQGATLTNPDGDALILDGARIDGDAFLEHLTAYGGVRAPSAHITGQLNLQGATLTNPNGNALTLDGARIDGDAFLDQLTASGAVQASGAHITGQLNLRGATLTNPNGDAFTLERSQVRLLIFDDVLVVKGTLNLARAQIGDLVTGDRPPSPFVAPGWRVEDLHGGLRTDRKAAARWLASAPRFVAQPWHELAQVYDRNGQPADARFLRLSAAQKTTTHAPSWSKPPRWAYGLLVGYGYLPLLAGAWLLAALLCACLITSTQTSSFLPGNPAALQSALAASSAASNTNQPGRAASLPGTPAASSVTGATPCSQLRGNYPCLRPLLYSLDVVLPPAVSTGQSTAWRPTKDWIAYTLTGLKTFGWLLTALLIAGVTGLLRKS